MSLSDVFFGSEFKRTIRRFCTDRGWSLADLQDGAASIRFRMNSGRVQTVFIIKYDTTLEFSCPSEVHFDDRSQMPHIGSTILLRRSRELKVGFWCIEKIGAKFVYSCMHNAEMSLIDSQYFARVVDVLANECERFEQSLR